MQKTMERLFQVLSRMLWYVAITLLAMATLIHCILKGIAWGAVAGIKIWDDEMRREIRLFSLTKDK